MVQRTIAVMFVVMGLASVAAAGTVSEQAPANKLSGCLEKGDEPGSFRLTHVGSDAPKTYELIPREGVRLEDHVGHKVAVNGESSGEKVETADEKKDEPYGRFDVISLQHVSDKCP
jgi:hypothetical protein